MSESKSMSMSKRAGGTGMSEGSSWKFDLQPTELVTPFPRTLGPSKPAAQSSHAVEPDAVALGILEDSNKSVLADGGAGLQDRTSSGWNPFQDTVEVAFDVQVNQRSSDTRRNTVHPGDRPANATSLLMREHAHPAVFHVEGLQGSLECGFVEALCAVEVVDVEFKPIHRVLFCSFAHSFVDSFLLMSEFCDKCRSNYPQR
jgi:hypothetical protein